jgi:nucleoside-diphosphate-sugar epimerase
LIATLEAIIGEKAQIQRLPAHPADMRANWASVEKAKRVLGWDPKVSLREGIENLVTWYKDERAWARHINTD